MRVVGRPHFTWRPNRQIDVCPYYGIIQNKTVFLPLLKVPVRARGQSRFWQDKLDDIVVPSQATAFQLVDDNIEEEQHNFDGIARPRQQQSMTILSVLWLNQKTGSIHVLMLATLANKRRRIIMEKAKRSTSIFNRWRLHGQEARTGKSRSCRSFIRIKGSLYILKSPTET